MWEHLVTIAVGGLENIGFANSGNIIVLSSQGRGIVDSSIGQKIFRDNRNWWEDFIEDEKAIPGFGGEEDAVIKLSGLHTEDFLQKATADGWSLFAEGSFHGAIPINKFYLRHVDYSEPIPVAEDGPCEVRAYGFANNEETMVIATSCELIVWIRK